MIAELLAVTNDLAAALFTVPVPAHSAVRVGLICVALLLFIACLLAAHAPRRDRGGFR